ncbi:hypothetical protein VF07_37825 [Nostoc linckia z6]|nr:hypothetical protein VF07_37825 [Nostoc linckia z6]
MAKLKNEAVTVSFHFLRREDHSEPSKPKYIPISLSVFDKLFVSLNEKPAVNLDDEEAVDRLRYRIDVPIVRVERVDERTIFGTYQSSYWGHAYQNTERGKIPATSISLRPFHFLLYLSEDGKIYVGSQYLGLFGGYSGLVSTLRHLIALSDVYSHSFRSDFIDLKQVQPKEIQIRFADRSESIAAANPIASAGVLTFRKTDKEGGFEEEIASRILSQRGKPSDEVRKAVANLVNESKLMSVNDDDIADCTVIVKQNGRDKKIHMIEDSGFSTRFPISVAVDDDGHPLCEPCKTEMISLLKKQIIAMNEDV